MKFNNYNDYFIVYRDTPLRWDFWVNILQTYKKKGNLLEIGCAEGHFLKRADKFYNVFGVDRSAKTIKKLKATGLKQVYVMDAINLKKFKQNYFDIIVLFDVLEHLREPEECLKGCSRIIGGGGIIVISVPNTSSILRFLKKDNWFGFTDKTHLSILPKKEWIDLLKKYEFRITKLASDGFWDIPYFSFLPKSIQKAFLIPGYAQYKLKRLVMPPIGENLIIIGVKE